MTNDTKQALDYYAEEAAPRLSKRNIYSADLTNIRELVKCAYLAGLQRARAEYNEHLRTNDELGREI